MKQTQIFVIWAVLHTDRSVPWGYYEYCRIFTKEQSAEAEQFADKKRQKGYPTRVVA